MAFVLAYSVTERGDSKVVTLTDTTGTGATGWGGANPAVSTIDSSTNTLDLDITVTTSDGTETSYDTIDLYAAFGPFATIADLVFALDCSLIKESTIAIGTADDVLPDGIYEFTYTWKKGLGGTETETASSVLIDGNLKADIYEMLRTIPTKYECDNNHDRDIMDIIFIKGYYDAMIATAIVGRNEQVIEQLNVLERLVANGSSYTW